jgi:hypothetical protein
MWDPGRLTTHPRPAIGIVSPRYFVGQQTNKEFVETRGRKDFHIKTTWPRPTCGLYCQSDRRMSEKCQVLQIEGVG